MEFVSVLGKGGCSHHVHLCTRQQPGGEVQELVAVKYIDVADTRAVTAITREVICQGPLYHPFVIELKGAGLDENPLQVYLVLEYANQGNLMEYINRLIDSKKFVPGSWGSWVLSEAHVRWFFQQLVLGLDYCHRRGVCNRDLKLENVLLARRPGVTEQALPMPHDLTVKIADFGLGKHAILNSKPKSRVGTLYYMAPEVLGANPNSRYDGELVDVWCAGVILYVLLFGGYPFGFAADVNIPTEVEVWNITQNIQHCSWERAPARGVAPPRGMPDAMDLLNRIFVADPAKRITLAGVMAHPWFTAQMFPQLFTMYNVHMSTPRRAEQLQQELNAVLQQLDALLQPQQEDHMAGLAPNPQQQQEAAGGDHHVGAGQQAAGAGPAAGFVMPTNSEIDRHISAEMANEPSGPSA